MNDKQETTLSNTTHALMAAGKGLIAIDESTLTCNKRFGLYDIAQTPEKRRDYRELLVTTAGLGQYISGAILYEETVRQLTSSGKSFVEVIEHAGIIPGIKVDNGTVDLTNFTDEKITEGLDGLRDRLIDFSSLGLRFAKWRAVFSISEGIPTDECIRANTQSLARYAALCQQAGLVLKPNMVLPGVNCADQNTVEEIAEATVKCFLRCVPAAVPGIAFLSGGQDGESATQRLNLINSKYGSKLPWSVTFSFSRALQLPALQCWKGKPENTLKAQKILLEKARCNSLARKGQYGLEQKKEINL